MDKIDKAIRKVAKVSRMVEEIEHLQVGGIMGCRECIDVTSQYSVLLNQELCSKYFVTTDNIDVYFIKSSQCGISFSISEGTNISDVYVKAEKVSDWMKIKIKCLRNNISGKITIRVPDCLNVKIFTRNGDVSVIDLSIEQLDIGTNNGDVIVDETKFKKAFVETNNGDIDFNLAENCLVNIHTVNGEVKEEGIDKSLPGASIIECRTHNGDIMIRRGF